MLEGARLMIFMTGLWSAGGLEFGIGQVLEIGNAWFLAK